MSEELTNPSGHIHGTDECTCERGQIHTPVALSLGDDGLMTLAFGPLSADDLDTMLAYLCSPEGGQKFREDLTVALQANMEERAKAAEGKAAEDPGDLS